MGKLRVGTGLISAFTRVMGIVGAVSLGVGAFALQEHPVESHTHTEGQSMTNPFEATSDSIARGRQRYRFTCRQCHGNTGLGDGDMSHAGGVPSDFTDDVWQHGESDGEIFLVIKEGVTADMQAYKNQIPDEDIWHLVNYLRTFSQ